MLSVVCCVLFGVRCSLFVVCCLLFVGCCWLFVVVVVFLRVGAILLLLFGVVWRLVFGRYAFGVWWLLVGDWSFGCSVFDVWCLAFRRFGVWRLLLLVCVVCWVVWVVC